MRTRRSGIFLRAIAGSEARELSMSGKPKLTGLSGNEIYCLRLKGFTPSGVVIGNSVQSMGLLGGIRSSFRAGEIADVTQMIHAGREAALKRMIAEAEREGVDGVVGVSSELRHLGTNSEFLFVG